MGWLFYLSILGYAFLVKIVVKGIKNGGAIFTALAGMLLFSYFGVSVLNACVPSAYISIYGGGVAFSFSLCWLFAKGWVSERCRGNSSFLSKAKAGGKSVLVVSKGMFSLSTVSFLLLCSVFTFTIRNMTFLYSDDYGFWGRAVRELFLFDTSYINSLSNLGYTDYPPLITSLQYGIVRVFGWNNDYLYYPIIAIMSASLALLYDFFKKENWKWVFAITFVIFTLLPTQWQGIPATFLGAESPLIFIFACAIGAWAFKKDSSFGSSLPVIFAAAILPGIKLYAGLGYGAVLVLALFFDFIRQRRKNNQQQDEKSNKKMSLSVPVLACAMVMVFQLSWSAVYNYRTEVKRVGVTIAQNEYLGLVGKSQAETEQIPFSIKHLFSGNPRNKQITQLAQGGKDTSQSIKNAMSLIRERLEYILLRRLGGDSAVYRQLPLALLYVCILILSIRYKNEKERPKGKRLFVFISIGSLIYFIGTMVAFVIQPSTLGSAARYLAVMDNTLLITSMFCAAKLAVVAPKRTFNVGKGIISFVVAFVLLLSNPTYILDAYRMHTDLPYHQSVLAAEELYTSWQGWFSLYDRTLVIHNTQNEGISRPLSYYALPQQIYTYTLPYENEEQVQQFSLNTLENLLKTARADGLVVIAEEEKVREHLSSLLGFSLPEEGEPLFIRVEVDEGKFSFEVED